MAAKPIPPTIEANGMVRSPSSGLYFPMNYHRVELSEIVTRLNGSGLGTGAGLNQGFQLDRDPDNLAVRWPAKGSGLDDFVNSAVVDGTIANVGVAPVVAPQISGMVRRQQNQAATASIDLTGRKSPVGLAREAIARFNDSPLGVTEALQQIVYNVCTYNRGAPIATVPITLGFDLWRENGMRIKPLIRDGQSEEGATRFYLEVNWARHGTPVPYLPNVYDLEPSGLAEWPYWYRLDRGNGDMIWVLLHQTHILPLLPGRSSLPGIGTSPVWVCLGVLAEQILVLEERAEKMLYSITDGITLLGGVEGASGDTILNSIKKARTDAFNQGFVVGKGQTILTSPSADKVSVAQVSFRQQPAGMDFQQWREYNEDVIAFSFGETLSALVIRGGVGYGVQSDTGADNSAESGVGALLNGVASVLGAIYQRVQVSVSRPNDRAQRLNVKTLMDFSTAATGLIDRGVLTPEEARAMIDRDIMVIPEVIADSVTTTANAEDNEDEAGSTDTSAQDETASDTTSADTAGNAPPATKARQAPGQKPVQAETRFATLYDDADLTIDDADVDRALELAQSRIDDDLVGMLNAVAVED